MKKSDLKQLIKPLVKECIHEVLLEEGLLSNVVSEVARGLRGNVIAEARTPDPKSEEIEELHMRKKAFQSRDALKEHRRKLMDSIGNDAYAGVDLFEGTEPMHQSEPQQGSADLGDPRDSGVDISSIFGNSAKIWQAMK
tara:strand:+ start:1180 stop:1596 length:417 start_codon:yes stop_codon:yes gene_type:complete